MLSYVAAVSLEMVCNSRSREVKVPFVITGVGSIQATILTQKSRDARVDNHVAELLLTAKLQLEQTVAAHFLRGGRCRRQLVLIVAPSGLG